MAKAKGPRPDDEEASGRDGHSIEQQSRRILAHEQLQGKVPAICRALVKLEEAGELLGLSATKVHSLDKAGLLPAPVRHLGRARLWCVAELLAWAAHDCPPREEWRKLWRELRQKGASR